MAIVQGSGVGSGSTGFSGPSSLSSNVAKTIKNNFPRSTVKATPKKKSPGVPSSSAGTTSAPKTTTTKTTTATKSTAAPANYNYVTNAWKPLIDQAINKVKQSYVDRGLLNSTAASESMGQAVAPITSGYAAAMEAAKNTDMNRALDVWKSLNAIGASKGAITGNLSDYQTVADLPWFANLFKTNFLAPTASTGPTGDPKEQSRGQVVERYQMFPGRTGRNMQGQQLDQQATLAANALAAAKERLQMQIDAQEQARKEAAAATDPYSDITGIVASPGNLAGHPSTLLNLIEAKYGINLEDEAKKDNPRALALFKVLYPATWNQRINGTPASNVTADSTISAPSLGYLSSSGGFGAR